MCICWLTPVRDAWFRQSQLGPQQHAQLGMCGVKRLWVPLVRARARTPAVTHIIRSGLCCLAVTRQQTVSLWWWAAAANQAAVACACVGQQGAGSCMPRPPARCVAWCWLCVAWKGRASVQSVHVAVWRMFCPF